MQLNIQIWYQCYSPHPPTPPPIQRRHLQHLGVSLIPEGLVAELAGVRQTCASFLLATGGHAEVTAAVGHLRGGRHVFTGG